MSSAISPQCRPPRERHARTHGNTHTHTHTQGVRAKVLGPGGRETEVMLEGDLKLGLALCHSTAQLERHGPVIKHFLRYLCMPCVGACACACACRVCMRARARATGGCGFRALFSWFRESFLPSACARGTWVSTWVSSVVNIRVRVWACVRAQGGTAGATRAVIAGACRPPLCAFLRQGRHTGAARAVGPVSAAAAQIRDERSDANVANRWQ